MSSKFVYCLIIFKITKMKEIFQSDYSMYSQNMSCLVILGFTQIAICFKVAMFNGLTGCLLFDYVTNDEMIKIF